MKVCVVGGGVTGCAVAYQIRKLARQREQDDAASAKKNGAASAAPPAAAGDAPAAHSPQTALAYQQIEVVLMDEKGNLGGSKFDSVVVPEARQAVAELGRTTNINFELPYTKEVLKDFKECEPYLEMSYGLHGKAIRSFGAYDYRKMYYSSEYAASPLLEKIPYTFLSTTWIGSILWRLTALGTVIALAYAAQEYEDLWVFVLCVYGACLLLVNAVVGPNIFWNVLQRTYSTMAWNLTTRMAYGAAPRKVSAELDEFDESLFLLHVNTIDVRCPTLSKLLARGRMLATLAMRSAADYFENTAKVGPPYLEAIANPAIGREYGSTVLDYRVFNALAAKAAMTRLDPVASRNSVGRLRHGLSHLCVSMAKSADSVLLNHIVTQVRFDPTIGQYNVTFINDKGRTCEETFDAVVLAACVNLDEVEVSCLDISAKAMLGYTDRSIRPFDAQLTDPAKTNKDLAVPHSYAAVVRGRLNPQYFSKRTEESVPDVLIVKDSPDVSFVNRIADGVYEIVVSSEPRFDSALLSKIFTEITSVIYRERKRPTFTHGLIPGANDPGLPSFIVGERLINACATRRLASDVEFDLMGARCAASFIVYDDKVWKNALSKGPESVE